MINANKNKILHFMCTFQYKFRNYSQLCNIIFSRFFFFFFINFSEFSAWMEIQSFLLFPSTFPFFSIYKTNTFPFLPFIKKNPLHFCIFWVLFNEFLLSMQCSFLIPFFWWGNYLCSKLFICKVTSLSVAPPPPSTTTIELVGNIDSLTRKSVLAHYCYYIYTYHNKEGDNPYQPLIATTYIPYML